MSHRKPKVGDVIQIALPDGQFAYGRVLNGGSVAFYREMTQVAASPPIGSRDYQFIVGVDARVLTMDEVPVVAHDPGAPGEDWAPNGAIQDAISGEWKLYDMKTGAITPSTAEATAGLEIVASWDLHHIVDRLMGFGHLWMGSAYEMGQEAKARRELERDE